MSYNNTNYPSKLLEEAVDAISSLPGVGQRSALRLALHLLKQPKEKVHHFTAAINALRDNIKYCRECMMITDNETCTICNDRSRNHRIICVVESIRDVMSIENTGQYHGVYHVLGGIISPINGIGPSDISIRELVARVSRLVEEEKASEAEMGTASEELDGIMKEPIEIILALSGDVEGETTSFYIYRQLSAFHLKVSSLARGLGFGDDLEYADSLTLGRSIVNRQIFKP